MLGDCSLPRLWGLSLLGTSLCVYCGTVNAETIEPASDFVPRPSPQPHLATRFFTRRMGYRHFIAGRI